MPNGYEPGDAEVMARNFLERQNKELRAEVKELKTKLNEVIEVVNLFTQNGLVPADSIRPL
jgi:hypothetical protein